MEIKSRARAVAKPWPALGDASGHSPCGHRAHPCPSPAWPWVTEHPPSSSRHTEPASQEHNQSTLFLGEQGSTTAFSDNMCSSSLESWLFLVGRLLRLRYFKIIWFIKPALQSPAASKPKTSKSMQGQLSSSPRRNETAAKGCRGSVSDKEPSPLQEKTCPMMKRKGWLIYLDILCSLMELQNEYQLGWGYQIKPSLDPWNKRPNILQWAPKLRCWQQTIIYPGLLLCVN